VDDLLPTLTAPELRVLGSLVEKQITTPDYYPLTPNALTNACNQLTNRDPVVAYPDNEVLRALEGLREKRLAVVFAGADSRVAKYKHTLNDRLLLTPAETALLCVLMLRGPQTLGELRVRAERLVPTPFATIGEVEEVLNALARRVAQPLAAKLPRQPGAKESRYTHLLAGAPITSAEDTSTSEPPTTTASAESERITRLETELAGLRSEITEIKHQFAAFRKQFD
jgi:uncharacterized protein YceH (UPF0502 family)